MTTSQLGHPAAGGKLIRFLKTLGALAFDEAINNTES
jgi:hypothetical protein